MPTHNSIIHDIPLRGTASRQVFRIIFVMGGIKSSLLRYFLRLLNVVVVVIDNAKEIEVLRRKHKGGHFISFVLGDTSVPLPC